MLKNAFASGFSRLILRGWKAAERVASDYVPLFIMCGCASASSIQFVFEFLQICLGRSTDRQLPCLSRAASRYLSVTRITFEQCCGKAVARI